MIGSEQAIIIIAVCAIVTFITRALPFILFSGRKEIPQMVTYLGKTLPPAIIATLIIYCLKDVNFSKFPNGVAEILAIIIVVIFHKWKENVLLSVLGGTICYMVLIKII